MADIKPLGSEKLNGDEKLKRILELTYFNQNKNKSFSAKPELVKESTTGGVFGIVKEKDGYYVKRGLNESSLDYIGGMFMKNKNKFSSYSEAFKRLELLKGQEELQEATKYVLKPSSPKTESPLSDPAANAPIPTPAEEPAPEAPMEVPSEEPAPEAPVDAPAPDAPVDGGDEASGKRSSYMAEVQKYAGKLGQELRDQHESMESDDIKYVLNMIISAVDLDKLEDEDIEDIAKKFERDEEQGGEEVPAEEPSPEDEVPAEEPVDSELGEEMDITMDALENFINEPADYNDIEETSLADYADLEMDEEIHADFAENIHVDFGEEVHADFAEGDIVWSEDTDSMEEPTDEEFELDLDEMKNEINNSIQTTLGKYFK
jgi:hypothetical protein